jgi:type IV secretory pathway VirB2 component (pilin)
VLALSRSSSMTARPWLLLLLGPLAFVVAVVGVMVAYNVLFASSHLPQ